MNNRLMSLLTTIVLIALFCINASAAHPREKDLDYPYRAMGGLFEGCIVHAENGIDFSDCSSNFESKKLIVYNRPFAVEEREKENGELYEATLFENDENHKNLCIENIKKYLEAAEEKSDGEYKQGTATDYKYYYTGQNVNVSSIGSRMSVWLKNTTVEYVMNLYESGRLTDDPYIKAALEMAGIDGFSYTRTDYIRGEGTGGIYYLYPSGAKDPQPYLAIIQFYIRVHDNDENESSITVDFQLNGYGEKKYGEYKAISYKEAFRRLKNNDYRSVHFFDDLSGISENDVLCELVYTDAIDLHYMMPCYKFYVEVKDEDWLTQEQVSDNEKLYFFYYVPAVDMNDNPETGETDPVAAAVCAVASAVLLAAVQINLKKFRKNT